MKHSKVRVVRVTTTGFELSDGRYYPHPIPLTEEELPTVQEFQEYYDHWFSILSKGNEREAANDC